ncbi:MULTISPECIES: hypothetical protein [unclassified Mesorhizobium]|uniref:hypothetical protein n=1 Tax=unclassified Mesorhizobium TaxID=325217 RepID=UPI001CCEEB4A|nr:MULTISPECIES: hypothetical protein [unclassified Mesorhizobium]MBZ9811386.1 hypothetical protein [Mesorhizobium sp. ESP-6-2]MBZ9811489.1 hypothetical protein [Mesorhizobium sp. ESP-6-2]
MLLPARDQAFSNSKREQLASPAVRRQQEREEQMQYAEDIALRRVKMLVEQYVLTRSRRYDFVSTEQACRAIREVMRSPIDDAELDRMLARSAARQGLSVRFDREAAWQVAPPCPTEGISI